MVRVRTASLALAVGALLASCTKSKPAPALAGRSAGAASPQTGVVATFTGSYDPASGKLSIEAAAPDPADLGALTVFLPFYDTTVGTGPVNSFEIVTDPDFAPTFVANDCDGGTVNAFEGDVTIRSFFTRQSLKNVYAELTLLSPQADNGCNSATPPTPSDGILTTLSDGYGLWSYGNLDPDGTPSVAQTRRWKLRNSNAGAFTFTGRVWATLAAPVPRSGDPEFNWYATSLVDPPRTFVEAPTTVSHIVWNGTGWTDSVGGAVFARQNGTGGTGSVGISDTLQPYATFADGSYWTFDPNPGFTTIDPSSRWNLAGPITVCAKFRPGTLPPEPHPPDNMKVLFAKGNPTFAGGPPGNHLGWALMEMNAEYCFHYGTPNSNLGAPFSTTTTELMTASPTPAANPETYAYDYICGGRGADGKLYMGIDGVVLSQEQTVSVSETFSGTNLPLAIGAFSTGPMDGTNGNSGAQDAGVYEIIIDSRPASAAVIAEIVGAAEGRLLRGVVNGAATIDTVNATSMATFNPMNAGASAITGANGTTYTLPPYATVQLSQDGSGLLPEGQVIQYSNPLFENTAATGFCAGAEVVANGAWANVFGQIIGFQGFDSRAGLFAPNPPFLAALAWLGDGFVSPTNFSGFVDGSAHVFQACVTSGGSVTLYVDGAQGTTGAGSPPNLSSNLAAFGGGWVAGGSQGSVSFGGKLSGARIRRVFMCPSPVAANCK